MTIPCCQQCKHWDGETYLKLILKCELIVHNLKAVETFMTEEFLDTSCGVKRLYLATTFLSGS